MSIRFKAAIIGTSVVLVLFAVLGGLGVRASSGEGAYRQLSVFSEVLSRIRSEYVEEPNMSQVTDGALHGLLESLDANSSYLNPAEYRQYKLRKADGKGGLGATLSKRFGYVAVVSVVPGGPADKAGVENGDIIEAIESRSTREMSLAEVRTMMAGEPGSNLTFSIVRPRRSEPQRITVTRDVVRYPPVVDRMLEAGIGYIKVQSLTPGKTAETATRIRALEKAGARSLLLDLRNASDGEASEGVAMANLFLARGVITYLQGQKYARETFTADPEKAVTNLPLAVLVNRGTAGAAEIVAAAVLENARGDVVGGKTFGIGSVQKLIEAPDGSALILSVAKYYSPGGKAIQDVAVTPSVLVADAGDEIDVSDDEVETEQPERVPEPQEDQPLRRAIELLRGRLQKA
ncbi:MAG: S41 family peptidase [Terriglobales bacterium]